MSLFHLPPARLPYRRRPWKAVAFVAACGAFVAVWFQEVVSHVLESLGLLLLPLLAGLIYALDLLMFRSRRLPPQVLPQASGKGGVK